MEQQMMKYTQSLQWRSRLICVPAAMFCVLSAHAQDRRIPPVGGPGGGEFIARCPAGQLLGGVELRAGDWIDAIRPLCRTPSVNVRKAYAYNRLIPALSHYYDVVTYPLSDATATTDWYGGSGGGITTVVCDSTAAGIHEPSVWGTVSAIYVEAEGQNTVTVNRITLLCERLTYGIATPGRSRDFWSGTRKNTSWEPDFRDPQKDITKTFSRPTSNFRGSGTSACPWNGNPASLAVGIHGRAGKWLDAVGLICDEPRPPPLPAPPPPPPVKAQGRVKLGAPTDAPTGPPRAICDLARQARARNSPAAPGLEAQCRAAGAAGEIAPVRAQGRVKLDAPTGAPTSPPRAICDLARQARARNSPAAPGLEQTCRADLAAKGFAIAQVDPIVAAARTAESDNLYRQGFDIATGIFGDPALGAEGRTATGPGSLGIRDQLTPAGQRGFNAAVTFHLDRKYGQVSVPAAPTITANPNPVMVPNGQDAGTTTITWTAAPDYTYCEIYLSVDNGEWSEFARGVDGSKPTTIKLGTSQTFRMMVYEGQAGTPKIIATLTVNAQ